MKRKNKQSLSTNFFFNLFYQIVNLVTPLITAPYLSKILLASGIGQYSYTFSITNIFALIGCLGFSLYGEREVAKNQDNIEEKSRVFWELIVFRLLTISVISLMFVSLTYIQMFSLYKMLLLLWLPYLVSQSFDITFLFYGNENFSQVVLRNLIVKIMTIVFIFTLVKTSDQVWVYILITSVGCFLSNASLWFCLKGLIQKVPLSSLHPFKHTKPVLKLFIPTIASSVYSVLDKFLLGILINDTYVTQVITNVNGIQETANVVNNYSDLENGYYEQAVKIINLCSTIVLAFGTVSIPQNSFFYSNNEKENFNRNIQLGASYTWAIGIPMTLGLIAIAPNFVPWFFGSGFEKTIVLIRILSPLIILQGLANVFGLQALVPIKKDSQYSMGVLIGAIVNVVLDLVLIHYFWSIGAAIGSLIAEGIVALVLALFVRKDINLKAVFKSSLKYLFCGFIMFIATFCTALFLESSILNTCLLILEGVVIYIGLLLITKDKFLFLLIDKVKEKFKK